MAVKMGSSGGGASSHEGRPNPTPANPMKQSDSIDKGGGTNDTGQKLFAAQLSQKNFPTCDSDYSGTSDESASRPAIIATEGHYEREQYK